MECVYKEVKMYIPSISASDNTFRGTLTVRDFNANKLLKYNMTKEAGENLYNIFSSKDMLNDRTFRSGKNITNHCLERLKKFVAFFSDSVNGTFGQELTYPTAKNFSAEYRVTDKLAEINVPEHFSIRLEV